MRRTSLLFALALAATACGEERPAAAPTVVEAAVAPRFSAGDVHRWAFDWEVAADADNGMLGDVPLHGGLRLRGELRMVAHEQREDGVLVGVRIERLEEGSVDVFGHDVLPGIAVLTGHEAMLLVPDDGDARRLFFDPSAPPVFRHVMAGLIAQVDLRVPQSSSSWRRIAPTGNGLAEVDYVRDADDPRALVRRVHRYLRMDAIPGLDPGSPWRVDGGTTIELGADDLPERIASEEIVALARDDGPLRYESTTRFELTRLDSTNEAALSVPSLVTWIEHDLHARPDDEEAQREMARRFAEGLTTTDLLIVVQSAANGLRPSPGFYVRARGLLRGWPDTAAELARPFAAAPDQRTRELILDLLVSADTPEAQAVAVELLDGPGSPRVELPALLQHLSLLRTPVPATAQLVLDMHARGRLEDDERLRRGSLYPMGTLAAGVAPADPMLAEHMLATLRAELDAATDPGDVEAALAGLSNAGHEEDVPRALAHREADSASVRAQVASSLRVGTTPETTDALFDLLRDHDRHVAASALSVIDTYRSADAVRDRLAMAVMTGAHHPDLSGPLASVLAKRGLEDPLCRGALVTLLQQETDPRARVRLRRLLGFHRA